MAHYVVGLGKHYNVHAICDIKSGIYDSMSVQAVHLYVEMYIVALIFANAPAGMCGHVTAVPLRQERADYLKAAASVLCKGPGMI